MQFSLPSSTTVKLAHMNVRAEKHGDEAVTALDLKFSYTSANSVLDQFDPALLTALYYRSKATQDQKEIEGVEKVAPDLRFPQLGTLTWDREMTARLGIKWGVKDEIVFNPVKVNQFRLECLEGGSVTVTFRCQTSSIPDGALDKLASLLDGEIEITLDPSEVKEAKPEKPASKAKKDDKPVQQSPTDAFVASGAPTVQ